MKRKEFVGRKGEKEGKRKKGGFSNAPTVEARQSDYKSWYTQRNLRVDTKNLEFRTTPKGRRFSYSVYFESKGNKMVGVVYRRP